VRRAAAAGLLLAVAACSPAPPPAAPTAEAPAADPPETAIADDPAAATADDEPGAAWERRLGNLPPDAAGVIRRLEACVHFAGEDIAARDPADRAAAEATIARLQCDAVAADADTVRQVYGDRPDVMEALALAERGLR
jgi:hypothetical protein